MPFAWQVRPVRILTLMLLWPLAALAQSDCIALAARDPDILPASYAPAEGVAIRYIAHAMFALTLPAGPMAVTDHNGHVGNPDVVPAVVPMNHDHAAISHPIPTRASRSS